MSDDFIKLDINDKELNKLLKELKAKGKNFSPLTAEIASYLYTATDENFDNESAFDGTPWQRLKDATVAAKGHSKKLHNSGKMRESLTQDSDAGQAVVGLNAYEKGYPYPAVHQFSSDKTPARPFLPFDEDKQLYSKAEEQIIKLVREFVKE